MEWSTRSLRSGVGFSAFGPTIPGFVQPHRRALEGERRPDATSNNFKIIAQCYCSISACYFPPDVETAHSFREP